VSGPSGAGKTHLLGAVLTAADGVVHRAGPLPDADQRSLLAGRLARWLPGGAGPPPDADWDVLLGAALDEVEATRRRLVLVLDDAHRLVEARSRVPAFLAEAWTRVRARGLPVHLVLAGRSPHLADAFGGEDGPLAAAATLELAVAPLGYREVGRLLPGYSAADRIRAWAAFGGFPYRLRHLDASVTLSTNIQKAFLTPGAPLHTDGLDTLARDVQSPARYVSILRALASGRSEWGAVLEAVPDVDAGAGMAPYLARLESLGVIRSERSLDASRRSRRRRYRIVDPSLAFWCRWVLPALSDVSPGTASEAWTASVRSGLEEHTALSFAAVCREFLGRHAAPLLGAVGRDVGGLWGSGYDLDPAGTLANGAVFYGHAYWGKRHAPPDAVDRLVTQVRRTRYGFGREGRHRLVFGAGGFTRETHRVAARDHLVQLVDLDHLLD